MNASETHPETAGGQRAGERTTLLPGTVRVRLTILYSGLFLITATILLLVVNLLLRNVLQHEVTAITEPAQGFGVLVGDGSAPDGAPGKDAGVPATGGAGIPDPVGGPAPGQGTVLQSRQLEVVSRLPGTVLDYQWTVTLITIAVLTVTSIAASWWLAGRMLRPLHRITATAHRLSLSNLDERIALAGPRDELKELADTFDAMLERLERSVNSQRRFIANAAHELRTPLAIQRAAIQIGLEDVTPERLPRVRETLIGANRRTERLIDALLILAQAEEGLKTTEPVRLDRLVHQVVEEIVSPDITISVDAQPAIVIGDPILLHRLLANLLENAVRYNHPGGTVDVGLAVAGTHTLLTVRNSGPVVPAERITEIFEPFRRLHATRTRSAEGAGLGLSIVASIAAAHHATLTANPNPSGGLVITVQFSTLPPPAPAALEP